MKEYILTLTSKGQVTVPVAVRRALGINEKGGTLTLLFNTKTKQAKIEVPIGFKDLQDLAAQYIKPDTKPLINPRELYEQREPKR